MKSYINWFLLSMALIVSLPSCTDISQKPAADAGCELVENYIKLKVEEDHDASETWYTYSMIKEQVKINFLDSENYSLEDIKEFMKEECGEENAALFIEAYNSTEFD